MGEVNIYQDMTSVHSKEVRLFDMAAQFNLGLMYDDGRDMDRNDNEAMRWDRIAADKDFALAQKKQQHGIHVLVKAEG
jgi:TPR repeat protein